MYFTVKWGKRVFMFSQLADQTGQVRKIDQIWFPKEYKVMARILISVRYCSKYYTWTDNLSTGLDLTHMWKNLWAKKKKKEKNLRFNETTKQQLIEKASKIKSLS